MHVDATGTAGAKELVCTPFHSPKAVEEWSLQQSLQLKLVKMGGRIVCHARRVVFQLA